jgi:hypothetical protein
MYIWHTGGAERKIHNTDEPALHIEYARWEDN